MVLNACPPISTLGAPLSSQGGQRPKDTLSSWGSHMASVDPTLFQLIIFHFYIVRIGQMASLLN